MPCTPTPNYAYALCSLIFDHSLSIFPHLRTQIQATLAPTTPVKIAWSLKDLTVQKLANYGLMSIFVNKALLGHSHAHSCFVVCG